MITTEVYDHERQIRSQASRTETSQKMFKVRYVHGSSRQLLCDLWNQPLADGPYPEMYGETLMNLDTKLVQLIQEAALQHELPIDLVYGIVCQESRGLVTATKYEPGFFQRYILNLAGLVSPEKRARATSWGLMQVMGQTARECGFKGKFEELFQPEVGLYWGCKYLAKLKAKYLSRWGWNGVIAAFNAGSPRKSGGAFTNQDYVDGVRGFMRSKPA